MSWKPRFLFLLVTSVPAFTGYPVNLSHVEVIAGVTYAWALYFLIANTCILMVMGKQFYTNAAAISAMITMPVVFVGSTVSYLIFLSGLGYELGQSAYSSHYVSLCISMLTVIPLAVSIVGVLPFQSFEQNLLRNQNGVSKLEKFFLMFLRVFNHILYFVIPSILEIIREEGQYRRSAGSSLTSAPELSLHGKVKRTKQKLIRLIRDMIQLGVEGICASIQYIPIWAVEISQLPAKSRKI